MTNITLSFSFRQRDISRKGFSKSRQTQSGDMEYLTPMISKLSRSSNFGFGATAGLLLVWYLEATRGVTIVVAGTVQPSEIPQDA